MDSYTEKTKHVVDKRFEMTVDGVHFSHQPIYGYRSKYSTGSHIVRYMLTKAILNTLNKFKFKNFIDVGGAEGYTAFLVGNMTGAKVMTTDLSGPACERATEIYGIPAVNCDIHDLPFDDKSYELVLCSETLEHVTDYKKAVQELLRITKNVLVITVPHDSPEFVANNIKNNVIHSHIHCFDEKTFEYLNESGYEVSVEKILSPYLIKPRVFAEAGVKVGKGLAYKTYNSLTPIIKKIFKKKTACLISDLDKLFIRRFKKYDGIIFTVVKDTLPVIHNKKEIKTSDFIDLIVRPSAKTLIRSDKSPFVHSYTVQ